MFPSSSSNSNCINPPGRRIVSSLITWCCRDRRWPARMTRISTYASHSAQISRNPRAFQHASLHTCDQQVSSSEAITEAPLRDPSIFLSGTRPHANSIPRLPFDQRRHKIGRVPPCLQSTQMPPSLSGPRILQSGPPNLMGTPVAASPPSSPPPPSPASHLLGLLQLHALTASTTATS